MIIIVGIIQNVLKHQEVLIGVLLLQLLILLKNGSLYGLKMQKMILYMELIDTLLIIRKQMNCSLDILIMV